MSDEMPVDLADRVCAARAFIIDMDGTLAMGNASSGGHAALPGAIEFLAQLRRCALPFRVFTNGTAKAPADYAASLRAAGFDLANDEMMTPSSVAADWFLKQKIGKVRVLGNRGTAQPLQDAGIDVVGPSETAGHVEAVFTGWFPDFGLKDLEAACHDVWLGARMTSASHVPFFASTAGRTIGISFAINTMIRSMTSRRALVLGKPSATAFHAALSHMGLPRSAAAEVVVLGDDPALEISMARKTGAIALGMTTGLMNRENVALLPIKDRPDHLFDDFEILTSLMSHRR